MPRAPKQPEDAAAKKARLERRRALQLSKKVAAEREERKKRIELRRARAEARRAAMKADAVRENKAVTDAVDRIEQIEDLRRIFGDDREIVCESCKIKKQVDEFLQMRSELDPNAPSPQVCDHCRTFGPPVKDPTAALTPQELYAMEALLAGASIREAARLSGVDYGDLSRMVRGKVMPHFRAALQNVLHHMGLTPQRLGLIMLDTLGAEQAKWNPMTKDWDFFPDHSNRRGAARDLLKMMGADEPKEQSIKAGEVGGLVVNIMTNIGSKQDSDDVPGTIVARARRINPVEIEGGDDA